MKIDSLDEAAEFYELRDPDMPSDVLAQLLGLSQGYEDGNGKPGCCLFRQGRVAAIRLSKEWVAFFPAHQIVRCSLEKIADPVPKD